ncbi:MAG TPA: CPBP family intramembrane glutamic endopeptidase [Blastocatellia bacterium]|nr:CPBP family intramembrane glutamic endopeptidase [Blastocatellia bacterium]
MSEPLDVAKYIFINDQNELRSGWRVLAFVFFIVLAEIMLAGLIKTLATLFPSLGFMIAEVSGGEDLTVRDLIALGVGSCRDFVATVVATALCARWLERRSFASVGFKLHRGWIRDFARGSAMGGSALAIAVGIGVGVGAVSFDVRTQTVAILVRGLVVTFMFFLISGATEELMFRGFPFQALTHNLGGAAAIGLTAVLFGLAHLSNKHASVFSTVNTILAGAWLGCAYLITRSLWLATALHYSWNLVMVFVFGLPVSGFTTFNHLSWLKGHSGAPIWISGGGYGPEGGGGATIALIVSTAVIWKCGWFTASNEMLLAIRHGKPESVVSITPKEPPEEDNSGFRPAAS